MTPNDPEPTPELRAGRRALEGVAGCQILEDFRWLGSLWALRLRLEPPGLEPTEFVPAGTDWFLLAGQDYPDGWVGLCPAKERGLVHTFPHQLLNSAGIAELPFRKGRICTDSTAKSLGRHDFDQEPRFPPARMRWHVLRALDWLVAASKDGLILPGEPLEFPFYPYTGPLIGFVEDETSFAAWSTIRAREGLAELVPYPGNHKILAVQQFSTWSGSPLVRAPWGAKVSEAQDKEIGVWVRWDSMPVLPPWQPPTTGRELREAASRAGTDLLSFLQRVPDHLRDGKPHFLLIGFPVSRRYRMPEERQHWLAIELPPFSRKGRELPGYQPKNAFREIDRRALLQSDSIGWVRTENWSEDEISSRGRFESELRRAEILIIGAGALGSAVAELLVRGGAHRLTILDKDVVWPGNLVRHSLTLKDVGRSKAESLADWLNDISPHASVKAIKGKFPPEAPESLGAAGIVLDCTGEDDVLADLARFPWTGERLFASASLGFYAHRLFLFQGRAKTFPREAMVTALQPWLLEERARAAGEELPWEGIGCYSAVSPARVDDVRLFASVVVKRLERLAAGLSADPRLLVFERGECLVRQVGGRPDA
ncbi:MAG: ThiF family adenylyltransferase [Acidobacteriota bacterium]